MRSGSLHRCRHCASEEVKVNRANETTQCESCDRILEERYNDFRTSIVLLDRDSPFPIVTQDGLSMYEFEEGQLADDPFHSTGFITAFSQTNIQSMGAFTLTARTFPGDLAELERIFGDIGMESPPGAQGAVVEMASKGNGEGKRCAENVQYSQILTAYFHIQEISDVLDLQMDDCDQAIRLFKSFVDVNFEAVVGRLEDFAVAALVVAQQRNARAGQTALLAQASGVAVNRIETAIQDMEQGLKSAAQNAGAEQQKPSAISVYMQRFCSLLGMSAPTEQVALRLGHNVTKKGVCARRNPHSVAAAVIYLAFNLEDQKKTQTEICKVTGLTEVTLRKVYKELLAEHQDVIPVDYTPKVPVKKLLPSGGLTTFRVDHLSSSLDISPQLIDSNGDVHGLSDVSGMDSMLGGINALMYQQMMQVMGQAMPPDHMNSEGGLSDVAIQQAQQTFSKMAASLPNFSFQASSTQGSDSMLPAGGIAGAAADDAQASFQQLFTKQLEVFQKVHQTANHSMSDDRGGGEI